MKVRTLYNEREKNQEPTVPVVWKCVFGAFSGCISTMLVQPLDIVKTRMQLQKGKNLTAWETGKGIVNRKGIQGLYAGISAALLRQVLYSGVRLGAFNSAFDKYKEVYGRPPDLRIMVVMGMISGVLGAVCIPAEVALIRMTSEGRLPIEKRKNYKHVFDALNRMVREEGIWVLTRGAWPTLTRSIILNASQLPAYSESRRRLLPIMGDGPGLYFVASIVAAFVATFATQPIDLVKTRIQNTLKNKTQFYVIKKIIQSQGVFGLWKGFTPSFLKLAPHTIITFMILEKINCIYLENVNKQRELWTVSSFCPTKPTE